MANYLDIKCLLHLGCAKVASLMKGAICSACCDQVGIHSSVVSLSGEPLDQIRNILSRGMVLPAAPPAANVGGLIVAPAPAPAAAAADTFDPLNQINTAASLPASQAAAPQAAAPQVQSCPYCGAQAV